VLRAIGNIGLSLILAVTLLFGGCLTSFAKSACCHPSSHCRKAPVRQDCKVQPSGAASAVTVTTPDIWVPAADVTIAFAVPAPEDKDGVRPPAPRQSPPDLCLLHSVIRV